MNKILFAPTISKKTKLLLICGPVGCILFTSLFLIQGAVREGYSPCRFPISSLSIGEFGWVQILNFLISGFLLFLFAFGLRKATPDLKGSVWVSILLGAVGLGMLGAGLFSTDPIYGYPMSAPLILAQYTVHGHLHNFFSIFVFTCLPAVCFIFYKRFKESGVHQWAIYSILSGIFILLTFILAGTGFNQFPLLVNVAGVFQRLSVITGVLWITLLAFKILKGSKQN